MRVYRKGLKFSVLTDDGEMCTDHGVADTKAVAPTDAPFLYFSMAIYEGVAYICGGKRGKCRLWSTSRFLDIFPI